MSIERRLLADHPVARNLLFASVALAFVAAALWLVLAWLLSEIVSSIFIAHRTLPDVIPLLALMLALMFVRAGLMWGSDVVAQHSANRVKSALRARLTAKLLALGPLFTRGERTGELVHAATTGIEALDEYFAQYQPARLLAGLVPALVLVAILVLDPWTLPILLFAGPILLLLLALIGGRARDLTKQRFVEMSWMSAHFMDMLQGLPTLKMFGRSREQAETIETISRHYGSTTMDVLRTAFQTSLVLEWGATAATALVAIEVSIRLMNGLMPFDLALTVLLLTPEFFLPLRQLAIKYHAGTAGTSAAERLYALLDTPGSVPTPTSPPVQALRPARLNIAFQDVRVSYDTAASPALDGLTLQIAAGQTVVLVGATGAGKTTVANLLLRFVEPLAGTITVDGIPLDQIDADWWRTQVAWVSQHPYLFSGTVIENLRLAKQDAALDEMHQAARAAHIHEFIESLPLGYDTPLGEYGARLSGGQRQRIAIARAFLKNAPLLILDEAASHLDAASQALIRASLQVPVKHRTTLIISHHLSFAYDADVVALLAAGKVVEIGSPNALRQHSGHYRALVTAYEGGAA